MLGLVGFTIVVAFAFPEVYQTQEDIMGFALTMENPAMTALLGVLYETESYNLGALFASEMLLFTIIAIGIMNILLMSSISREDEQEGRLEIVQSLPVGKIAYLTAGVFLLVVINLLIGLLTTTGLLLVDHQDFSLGSSALYSAVLASSGLFFVGMTALFAQLVDTSYGTKQIAFGALGLFYIIRMIGDVQSETLSLLSPLGWAVRSDVFVSDEWWPVVALIVGFILFSGLAFYLRIKRDMFSGLLPSRGGKRQASAFLKTIPGFVFHLQKTKIISWVLLIIGISAASGAILGEMETYFSDLDLLQQLLSGSAGENMMEQFIAYLIAILSIFSLFPPITILISLRSEELAQRTEHLYTRTVSRNQLLFTYFIYALFASLLIQLGIAIAIYPTSTNVLDDSLSLMNFIEMSFVYLPAIFLVVSLVALLIGVLPKFTQAIWLYVTFIFIVLYLGGLLEFPNWVNNLSAFHHVPEYPNEAINWTTLGILGLIGLVFTGIGFVGYNKRDMEG